ncbi:hypothetical protein [Pseudohoeflea coraliihabitans]|uniref:Uncharacterized protein n=1 Tax=Pseudohoeflea coraliihabitans TaxID=2860393 RepID=A0ABS6WTG2_9HYPH|nr:hypothetical protein [Pseudohoeflea sp. DP4N28-3]MBW3099248.1 hypothetical protein [Pseudohoeflea sp. DP4N28-3]
MFNLSTRYEHPGLGDDHDEDPFAHAKMATAKWTGELLDRHYPGHPWYCEVVMSKTGGLIKIQLRGLMPTNRWYCCQLSDVLNDPGGKRTVLRGAGEILERYSIRRGAFNVDDWQSAMIKAPISGRGHLAPLLQ